jgi:hypothetical protein
MTFQNSLAWYRTTSRAVMGIYLIGTEAAWPVSLMILVDTGILLILGFVGGRHQCTLLIDFDVHRKLSL